jgi:hypothetical protein
VLRLKEAYKETYEARPQGAPADCAHCVGDAREGSGAREGEGEDCEAPNR